MTTENRETRWPQSDAGTTEPKKAYTETIQGVVVVSDPATGRVTWMSDWTKCDTLAQNGWLRRVHHGPATYGHCTYHVDHGTPSP